MARACWPCAPLSPLAANPGRDRASQEFHAEPLRLAIEDLIQSYPGRYANGVEYLQRLGQLEGSIPNTLAALKSSKVEDYEKLVRLIDDCDQLQRQALLANPLLDFNKMLLIRRTPHGDPRMAIGTGFGVGEYIGLPRQTSKHTPDIEKPFDWDNEIAVLSPPRGWAAHDALQARSAAIAQ